MGYNSRPVSNEKIERKNYIENHMLGKRYLLRTQGLVTMRFRKRDRIVIDRAMDGRCLARALIFQITMHVSYLHSCVKTSVVFGGTVIRKAFDIKECNF